MENIAVLTSGGDAPGMNAAIRAVVRTGIYHGIEVYGIDRGFKGLIKGDFYPMPSQSVSNIIQKGGTILKSARCEEFKTKEGREKAAEQLKAKGIDGLVAIGGDGTFTGCQLMCQEQGIPTIGIPGTIDNDLYGTDYTLGYDTSVNTALEAVDRLRDTADSHDRLFFIEVMGRDAGFIALNVGLSGGAEAIMIPETDTNLDYVADKLHQGWQRQKSSSIIVVAEGDEEGGAFDVVQKIKHQIPEFEYRVSILGHIQRGGSPTAMDRVLGSRLGYAAVMGLMDGRKDEMVGVVNHQMAFTSFTESIGNKKQIDNTLVKLAEILST